MAIKNIAVAVAVAASIGAAAMVSYLLTQKTFEHFAGKFNVLHTGNDLSRMCLIQCKDKAVERFYVTEGKLECGCSEIKDSQKR